MFANRIKTFQGVVREAGLAPEVADIAHQFLVLMEHVNSLYHNRGMFISGSGMAQYMEMTLDELRSVVSSGANFPVLTWLRTSARYLADEVHDKIGIADSETRHFMDQYYSDSLAIADRASVMMDYFSISRDREQILDQARQAVVEANTAADTAKRSAGITGEVKLSEHFEKYAEQEKKGANGFRIAAIVSVAVAFVVAVAFGPIEAGDWAHLTYRVASVAGAGTLAAYFARQAGQHRRIYNWAKSLEVQLLSFPAFIEPMREEERAEAYRTLSRRILSAPPEKGTESAEDGVGATQLIDLATAAVKRS